MHTIYSTRYQSPERCMKLSKFTKAQLSPNYLSFHISNSVEIREIGKFLKEVKINQDMIKKSRKTGLPEGNPARFLIFLC